MEENNFLSEATSEFKNVCSILGAELGNGNNNPTGNITIEEDSKKPLSEETITLNLKIRSERIQPRPNFYHTLQSRYYRKN